MIFLLLLIVDYFTTTDLTDLTDSSCAWAFHYTDFSKITAAKAAIAFHKKAGKNL